MTLAEIQELTASTDSKLIEQTQSKPYKGQEWQPGTVGGTWNTSILADPKTFNHLIAERDADSAAIIGMTTDYLVDYDMLTRQWIPHAASFEIETDYENDTLTVHFTLQDYRLLIYPLILIFVMLFRPQGLLGMREISFVRLWDKLMAKIGSKAAGNSTKKAGSGKGDAQ